MEVKKKLETDLTSTWMIDYIQYFPVDKKQYFTTILHCQANFPRSMWKTYAIHNQLSNNIKFIV